MTSVWRALALVVFAVVAASALSGSHGLDVAKSQQGWSLAGRDALEDSLEALVVRDGSVAASFSVESSILQQAMGGLTFDLPSIFSSPFFSLFPRPYVEHAQQSHFLVRHDAPVEVVNFGVVDGLGQITRSDPALQVSAVFKQYSVAGYPTTMSEEGHYLYHLELDYACSAADPVRRLVVVQLGMPTAPEAARVTSPAEIKQSSAGEVERQSPTLTFVFRKQCPLPTPPPEQASQYRGLDPIAAMLTAWSGPLGGSMSTSSGKEVLVRSRRPAMIVMPVIDGSQPQSHRADEQLQYGHQRTPGFGHRDSGETAQQYGSVLQRVFNMPPWLGDFLGVVGMATILMVVVVALVDLLKGLCSNACECDEHEEMLLGEYESVPLLSANDDEMIIVEEGKCTLEELATPNPEMLMTTNTEMQEATEPVEQQLL